MKSYKEKCNDLQTKLECKNIKDNIIFFNPKITFEYCRQFKSYEEQLEGMTKEELLNCEHNELIISNLGVKITKTEVNTNFNIKEYIISSSYNNKKILSYKLFKYNNTEITPNVIESISKIKDLEKEISRLNNEIKLESEKIINSDCIKSILSVNVIELD